MRVIRLVMWKGVSRQYECMYSLSSYEAVIRAYLGVKYLFDASGPPNSSYARRGCEEYFAHRPSRERVLRRPMAALKFYYCITMDGLELRANQPAYGTLFKMLNSKASRELGERLVKLDLGRFRATRVQLVPL